MADAPLRVFISYSRTDSASFVDTLEADLKQHALDPWVDRHSLPGGAMWLRAIQDAIDEAQAMVVVLSPGALLSDYILIEYSYALSNKKLVIPVRHLPITKTPMALHHLQWMDFQASYPAGLAQLVQSLTRLKPPTPPTPPPVTPPPQAAPAKPAPAKTAKQWTDEGIAHREAKRYTEALAAFMRRCGWMPAMPLLIIIVVGRSMNASGMRKHWWPMIEPSN